MHWDGRAGSVRTWVGAVALLLGGAVAGGCARTPDPVILVGLDAFGWDFRSKADTPNLDRIAAAGVAAEWMVPVFPTKTFPNHYSIVTGLYPEHHGIVANTMYDADLDAWFRLSDREAVMDGRWWGGEPVWVTAAKHGLTTAAFFWPGTEAAIQGIRPDRWKPYVHTTPNDIRVDTVLSWLDLPIEERPSLITMYFADVDDATHAYGTDAPETQAAIREVDRAVGRLLAGLDARGLLGKLNIVIVSDHGMADVARDRVIFLDDYLDLASVRIIDPSPLASIRPEPGDEDRVYEALAGRSPHLAVYRREESPARWHFRAHRRIQPLQALADDGWSISTRSYFATHPQAYRGATHGYDNALPSMRATFLAMGPAFRRGVTVPPFQNIHVYELLCRLLGIAPAPNDGSPDSVTMLLRD
jgi:predicted AlkP superfamily pyrophosphatase or phosphodiesterase